MPGITVPCAQRFSVYWLTGGGEGGTTGGVSVTSKQVNEWRPATDFLTSPLLVYI
jgi:hypothetical protein